MHTDPRSTVAHLPRTPVFHAEKGTLYVLATPLGNLRDITLRGLDILASVDRVLAEDTRVSARLLSHYGIRAPLQALHQHNERQNAQSVLDALRAGQSLALISDAGTPAVSDPGARLIDSLREAASPAPRIVPIPGPCAAIAALSAAGLTAEHFYFAGFLPTQGKARRTLLERLRRLQQSSAALVLYEAPHRVRATVAALAQIFDGAHRLVIARELTKTFETIVRLPLAEAPAWIDAHPETERGELVLILDAAQADDDPDRIAQEEMLDRWLPALLEELPPARAARVAAAATGIARATIYEEIMRRHAAGER